LITLIAAIALGPVVHSELLDNGAWIVAISIPGSRSFSAQTFVRVGSVFETDETAGSAHLLEHLLFADGEADKIAENAGCLLNATTYREFMRLHAFGPTPAWQNGVKAVARLFGMPRWEAASKEARVIREEAELRRLDPDQRAYEGLISALTSGTAWERQPLGAGGESGARPLRERHFVGKNVVAVVAGDFDARAALADLRKAYAGLPSGEAVAAPAVPALTPRRIEGETGRVAIGAPSPGYSDLRGYLAMEVVVDSLTSPNRLEPNDLKARSFFGPSSPGVPVVVSFRSANGAPGLESRIGRVLGGGVSDAEFVVGVARLRSRYRLETPDSAAIAVGLGILLTGRTPDFEAELERLTKADVDAAAAAFAPSKVAWSVGR
jgi:hypothetical protein